MPSWVFGFDHAGFELAHYLKGVLHDWGDTVKVFGPRTADAPVDYVPYCVAAAEHVAQHRATFGVVIGGSGQGEQMAANKVRGIRAALVTDLNYAMLARRDNDANILALPGRIMAREYAQQVLAIWRNTSFEGGRHSRRLEDIAKYERGELSLDLAALEGGG